MNAIDLFSFSWCKIFKLFFWMEEEEGKVGDPSGNQTHDLRDTTRPTLHPLGHETNHGTNKNDP